MHQRRIFRFTAQHRWWQQHPERHAVLQRGTVPHRSTLSRRDKALDDVVQDCIAFVGVYGEDLEPRLRAQDLHSDKSLCKASGPVWPQSDRIDGRLPDTLRHLDPDGAWSKSGAHGWGYGSGFPLVNHRAGFPKMVQVETASVAEKVVMDQQADQMIHDLRPATMRTDNSDAQAHRIRPWATRGVLFFSPAGNWTTGRYATAYHDSIDPPEPRALWQSRRPAIEPMFALVAKALGTTGRQKQLAIQRLDNVRTCLALATFTVQVAMIANSIWDVP